MNTFTILSAEYVGQANIVDDVIDVGGLKIPLGLTPWKGYLPPSIGVYLRRDSTDLSVMEIHIARHDGYAQEELDQQNDEAERYPLGPKEYWRSEMVGKYRYGVDAHIMTNEEFESDWAEDE